jgi:hypothetical protein
VSKNKNLGVLACFVVMGLTFVAFQNCSRTNFKVADESIGVLKTEGGDVASGSETTPGDDVNVSNPVPDVASAPTPEHPGKNPKQGDSPAPVVDLPEQDTSSLIECELGHPNKKVIFGESFAPGSNASSTRACMSEDSCLKVINAYAAVRGCELKAGPATSETSPNSQCTKIFPGSKGTCHNAKILSDEAVVKILENMAK